VAREFRLPDIGEGLTEAEIVRWLVPEGEYVEQDQAIVELETDKAVVEIPSPYAGVVLRHGGSEGEVIEVGTVLVVIGEPGETAEPDAIAADSEPVQSGDAASAEGPPAAPAERTTTPIVGTISEEAEMLGAQAPISSHGVKALPVVRKLARDLGVDLESLAGSGPGGRITREDVEAAAETMRPSPEPTAAPEEETSTPPSEAPRSQAGYQSGRQPLSRLRRTIAANMSKSWAEIPHVTTFDDVDASRLLEVRSALASRHDTKIPIEALVIKAVVPALEAFPEFNATLDGEELLVHENHHIGIAVDTPEGLMVAVIRDAAAKSVLELAEEVRRLGEGARARSLGVDELSGQTFTVSNIGAVGGGHGTPIVPYGTMAILSVGMARPKPIVFDDDLVIAPVMPVSLSYDHRIIDGAQGRRFMSLVIENLEEPALFLAG
jgi:pyruvate dehydrogenase E2 component (dihydrolipoamide acetyltransferase)